MQQCTVRCSELKRTLHQTRSFIKTGSSSNVMMRDPTPLRPSLVASPDKVQEDDEGDDEGDEDEDDEDDEVDEDDGDV